jgi:hypothetical protein
MKKLFIFAILSLGLTNLQAQNSSLSTTQVSTTSPQIIANSLDDAYEKLAKIAKHKKIGIYIAFKTVQGDQYGKYTPSSFKVDQFREKAMQELRNSSPNRIEVRTSSGQVVGYAIVALDEGILSPEQLNLFVKN